MKKQLAILALVAVAAVTVPQAQQRINPAPDRRAGEGAGPFKRMVIRGVTIIDGTGAPPAGPMDVVIEGNRIASIRSAGTPGIPLASNRQPPINLRVMSFGLTMKPLPASSAPPAGWNS